MTFNIKGKEVELKYTFNSFKYLQDFDLRELEKVNDQPFKIIGIATQLILGAVNWTPNKVYSLVDVNKALEEYIKEDSISELLDELMAMLQGSDFFKSLQMKK